MWDIKYFTKSHKVSDIRHNWVLNKLMTEKQPDGWPETFHLFTNPLRAIGHFIKESVTMHQLSEHSDHFQHPLDTPITPVTHLPGEEV